MRFLLLFLLWLIPTTRTHAQEPGLDVQHYAIDISLSDESNTIEGKADIEVLFTENTDRFALDLIGRSSAISQKGMTVQSVSIDGTAVDFSHDDDRLSIPLSPSARAGSKHRISVHYTGEPADGLVISTNKFGDRTFFGDNWPNRARHWIPAVDHPSDKATFEFLVAAPDHYQVVGTGNLVEETDLDNGMRRTHWQTRVPIPTKVAVIGVARFAIRHTGSYKGIPIQAWVYPQDRDAGFHDFSVTHDMLAYFEQEIGPYPYEKLANVQSTTRYGGMENATNIFYDENAITGQQRNMGTVAHEIAHQWFGDSVTEADWQHIWLSEGFATYFTQLYMEAAFGRERLVEGMTRSRQRVLGFYERRPNAPVVNPAITDPNQHSNTNSYQKGGWVLHMLRHRIGDEAFWDGIRAYYESFRDANATSEDLQQKMEEASGQNLETFFKQWLYQPGQPLLDATWSYANGKLGLSIEQTQTTGLFDFPLEIGIEYPDGSVELKRIEMNTQKAAYSFDVSAQPRRIVLDPNVWLLAGFQVSNSS